MGLVLWVDQNSFLTNLLERVFKTSEIELYTVARVPDVQYLVEDLKPILIVLDVKTIQSARQEFQKQFEASEQLRTTPIVLIGGTLDLEATFVAQIGLPVEPFKIPAQLAGLIARIKG